MCMIKLTCIHRQRYANVCTWTYVNPYVHIHTHSVYTYLSLDTCIWMRCPHIWVYVSLHMCVNVCILHKCLFMHEPSCFCTVCMFVCLPIVFHPAFWDISPCLRGRLRIRSQGLRGKRMRGVPETCSLDISNPHLAAVSPIDSKGQMISSHFSLHPHASGSHFVPP